MADPAAELRRLAVDLSRAGHRAAERVALVVSKTAHDIQGDAAALAPVDTGNLRNSITIDTEETAGGGIDVTVGPTANYGDFVERGTSQHGPQPYLAPAFDRRVPFLVKAVEQIGGSVLDG